MVITLAHLEEELSSQDEPFFFYAEPETENSGVYPSHSASVCCLEVVIDFETQEVKIDKHLSEGPEYLSEFSGSGFKDYTKTIAKILAEDVHLEHAEHHGFEVDAFLALHALFAAHQAQWYGDNSGEYCESSSEEDLRWLRFFRHYFSKISIGDCECAAEALVVLENIKEYATDLEISI